jgi:uncharacterized protein (DUF2384 family)
MRELFLKNTIFYQMALELFATKQDAANWLHLPHPLLEWVSPLDAAKTSDQNVKNLLMSMKYGGAA